MEHFLPFFISSNNAWILKNEKGVYTWLVSMKEYNLTQILEGLLGLERGIPSTINGLVGHKMFLTLLCSQYFQSFYVYCTLLRLKASRVHCANPSLYCLVGRFVSRLSLKHMACRGLLPTTQHMVTRLVGPVPRTAED